MAFYFMKYTEGVIKGGWRGIKLFQQFFKLLSPPPIKDSVHCATTVKQFNTSATSSWNCTESLFSSHIKRFSVTNLDFQSVLSNEDDGLVCADSMNTRSRRSQGPPVCDFVETPIISGRMNEQLKTRCCCLGDMTSSSVQQKMFTTASSIATYKITLSVR